MNNYQPPIPPDPKKKCGNCRWAVMPDGFSRMPFSDNCALLQFIVITFCKKGGAIVEATGTCDNWEEKKE